MNLSSSAAASLAKWHDMIAKSGSVGPRTVSSRTNAVFRSPVANTPYPGKKVVCIVLRGAMQGVPGFRPITANSTTDANSVCLEFAARVGDKELKGIDLVKFDESGKIVAFEVMVRPLTGVMALGEAMKATVGPAIRAALEERA
jgi:hypothetical protein